MLETPLHKQFYRSLHKKGTTFVGKDYGPRLMSYRRRLEKAQRFVLNDSAVWEIVERSDLDLKHLMDRVQLAMLPFDEVWIEYSQHAKVQANYAGGRGPKPEFETVPERVGFLFRRAGGPGQWIATRVVSFDNPSDHTVNKFLSQCHGLSMFDYVFDADSNAPIKELGGQRSFVNDLPEVLTAGKGFDLVGVARNMWGGGFDPDAHDPLREADKKATIAFNPLWHDWYHKMLDNPRRDPQGLADALVTEFIELKGEFRFLVTALAIMNEVPILLTDGPPDEGRFYGGAKMQPYLTHRTVAINIPVKGRKQRTVADYLKVAASKKRRHMVRGHLRRYRDKAGQIVRERWIEAHARGSAELGWVNHDYEVKHKDAYEGQ